MRSLAGRIISWVFGIVVLVAGTINAFWGNDTLFGVFIILLSFIYFPPANDVLKKLTGFTIPPLLKIILGLLVTWAALGVGELFSKIHLMLADLSALFK